MTFPNSSIGSKSGFRNVVGLGLCIFPQFKKEMENWDFWKAKVAFPNFFQSIKEFENWDF